MDLYGIYQLVSTVINLDKGSFSIRFENQGLVLQVDLNIKDGLCNRKIIPYEELRLLNDPSFFIEGQIKYMIKEIENEKIL